jgi:hypothetical protein
MHLGYALRLADLRQPDRVALRVDPTSEVFGAAIGHLDRRILESLREPRSQLLGVRAAGQPDREPVNGVRDEESPAQQSDQEAKRHCRHGERDEPC